MAQWRIIWILAVFLILSWPSERGGSLAVKIVRHLADPADTLPVMPAPLPIGLDDNGDAVAARDAQEAEYQRLYAGSGMTRFRMRLKDASDPFDVSTQRQILTGIAIIGALAVWRLNKERRMN
jgi:hypothetical protein